VITLGVLMQRILKKIPRNKRGRFACAIFQRAVEGTEGHREDKGPWRGKRVVEETEGRSEDKEP
jgi:hypothetical protein